MPVDLKGSLIIQNQRDLLGKNEIIEKLERKTYKLEEEKNKLISSFPQQEISGRLEGLNQTINQINQAMERLIQERNKIQIKVPEK